MENVSEELYGQVMREAPQLKDRFVVQTKCGICRGYYDSSYEHIMESGYQPEADESGFH